MLLAALEAKVFRSCEEAGLAASLAIVLLGLLWVLAQRLLLAHSLRRFRGLIVVIIHLVITLSLRFSIRLWLRSVGCHIAIVTLSRLVLLLLCLRLLRVLIQIVRQARNSRIRCSGICFLFMTLYLIDYLLEDEILSILCIDLIGRI